MIRSAMMRLLAHTVAVSASLATPTAAVAHGFAHHEAAEHAQHHASSTAHETDQPAVSAPDQHEDHAHPRLDPSAVTRVVKDLAAIHSTAITLAPANVVCLETLDAPEPNETPPDRPGAAPPQSRAPPVL